MREGRRGPIAWVDTGQALAADPDVHQALIHQARKIFGSWDAARAAAGV